MDISSASTAELLREAVCRSDIRDANGVLSLEAYDFVRTFAVLAAVDSIPVKVPLELPPKVGFIRRNTGFYRGKWWMVGGRVLVGETNEMAVRRNYLEVLGVEIGEPLFGGWFRPAAMGQHVCGIELAEKLGPFVGHNPPYQNISPIYLVPLKSEDVTFVRTAHGGQEASAFEWFPLDALPPEDDFAYRGYHIVKLALSAFNGIFGA